MLTLNFYSENAKEYACFETSNNNSNWGKNILLAELCEGSKILEIGTGGGYDAQFFLQRGYDVLMTEASAKLALETSKKLGKEIRVCTVSDIREVNHFHAVWANSVFSHIPRSNINQVIKTLLQSLRAGGWLVFSVHAGEEDSRDACGRLYVGYTISSLERILHKYQPSSLKFWKCRDLAFTGDEVEQIWVACKF
ncbi:class I SAM-dependent methyltransferase [Vibrio metschnikovii]|uniref:class I SAM-dependent methyltransferase n=1 Tax=Vibrio metschnikovii TaxID=28172 RepID=UPI003332BC28